MTVLPLRPDRAAAGLRFAALLPVAATLLALVVGFALIALMSGSPVRALQAFADGAFGSRYALGASINRATALALVGLGFILAFRANLTNVGGEGQIALGGMAATAVALHGHVASLPFGLAVLLPLAAAILAGGAWGATAGWLKARNGTNEVISTLLLSFIGLWLLYWSVHSDGMLRQPRTDATSLPESLDVPDTTMIPVWLAAPLHYGALAALGLAIGVDVLLRRTAFGLRLRAAGLNERAARRAGIAAGRLTVLALALAGAFGGLAGALMIQGEQFNLKAGFSSGYGIDGLVVGLLARGSVAGVLAYALFFGFLRSGGISMEIAANVPSAVVLLMQGLIVVTVAGAEAWMRDRETR